MANRTPTSPGRGTSVLLVLLAIVLALLAALLVPLIYLNAYMDGVLAPAGSALASGRAAALASLVVLILLGVLALLCVGGIILASIHRMRRLPLTLGVSLLTTALLTAAIAFAWSTLTGLLGSEWATALAGTADSYASWALPCACLIAAVGAALVSVYACIRAGERGRS